MARRGEGFWKRGDTWYLDFRYRGVRYYERLGPPGLSRTTARELAAARKAEILRGESGIVGRRKLDICFTQASEHFIKWAEANRKPKTVKCYGDFLKALEMAFGRKKLSEIHPFLLEKYKRKRIKAGAPVAVNRELALLKNIFNRMIEWKYFAGENPVTKVKLIRETRGRTRFLTPEEEVALLAAASEPTRTIILVGLYTGLRVASEALTLTKDDVDLANGVLTVQAAHAKNGVTKTVPLHPCLMDPLRRQMKRSRSEWVFTKRDRVSRLTDNRTGFYAACRRAKLADGRPAKLDDVSPHCLRHTFASRLAMNGFDIRTIQELGGWRTITMVQRYAHLSDRHKREAIHSLNRKNSPSVFQPTSADESSESPQTVAGT